MKKITTFIGALLFTAITVGAFANAKHRVLPQVFYQDSVSGLCEQAFADVCETIGAENCDQDIFANENGTGLITHAQVYQAQSTNPALCTQPYDRTAK